jgi:hypothetical protein
MLLAGMLAFAAVATAQFVPDEVQVGAPGVSYGDPEFYSSGNRMVFQNSSNGVPPVWIAELFQQSQANLTIRSNTPTHTSLVTDMTQPGFGYRLETSTTLSARTSLGPVHAGNGAAFITNVLTFGQDGQLFGLCLLANSP